MIDTVLQFMGQFIPDINKYIGAGLVIFARIAAFLKFAPGFTRKEIPTMIKVSFALIFTIILTSVIPITPQPADVSLILVIALNVLFGALIAFIADCILQVMEAGGDMINMQMGLSAASVMDPASGHQTSVMGRFFSLIGIILFINLGGIYWLFNAFVRSFEIFPVWATSIPLEQLINLPYLVEITSNILYVGLQIAAPVLLATLGQDIILGVISRTAPQINVFTMSFLFKPILGCCILLWIMGSLINIVNDYFISFAHIF